MPFIEENDLVALHGQIDEAIKEADEAKKGLEDIELEHEQQTEELKTLKKDTKIQNILLSILTGVALAVAVYFYSYKNTSSSIDINEFKRAETTRILDSINSVSFNDSNAPSDISENDNNSISTGESFNESIDNIKQNIKGEKVYSVQVGAFYENRFPSLSESLAGISSNGDMFKYSIGLFKTLKEAQKFRRELVKVGFDDAFVASYVDGRRKGIENPN